MSKEILPETTTVTISMQHFNGETFVATSTVTGLHAADVARAARCAMAGLEFAGETVDKYIPPCDE